MTRQSQIVHALVLGLVWAIMFWILDDISGSKHSDYVMIFAVGALAYYMGRRDESEDREDTDGEG